MRIHKASIVGPSSYSPTIENSLDITNKEYVDGKINQTVAPVFVTDVSPQDTGNVGLIQYAASLPSSFVITEVTTDTLDLRISFLAEGPANSFSPTLTLRIDDEPEQEVTFIEVLDQANRVYVGYFDISIEQTCIIQVSSSSGAYTEILVNLLEEIPVINVFTLGDLPQGQTEVKEGDVVQVLGSTTNDVQTVEVVDSDAAFSGVITLDVEDSGGPGIKLFSGHIVISDRMGSLQAHVVGYNEIGTDTAEVSSNNVVELNQTFPEISDIVVGYPSGQAALKGSESAVINAVITDFDAVIYITSDDLSVTDPLAYDPDKTVTRLSGTYIYNNDNYTIIASKTSNGAVTEAHAKVNIATESPTAIVEIHEDTLRSSIEGELYTVLLEANQVLLEAPTLGLQPNGGQWFDSWTYSGTFWTRQLQIADANAEPGSYTFINIVLPSQAGPSLDGHSLTSGDEYEIRGFVQRSLTFPAFAQFVPIGFSVTDPSKVIVTYPDIDEPLLYRSDTNNALDSFTITNNDGQHLFNGDHLFLSDESLVNANTTGALLVTIEELV